MVGNEDNDSEICELDVEENECDNGELGFEKRLNFVQIASRDPVEIYKELREATKCEKQTRADWDTLIEIFRCFAKSGWASNQALAVYIGASFFPTAAREKFLFPIFVEFCLEEFPDEIKN
ncbi:hypothetical protein K7X08_028762 [Anisodus acutangulus]|uniref:DExH18 N-terminal domain-containing protein n=1 Tax=Anisodus acutangulus TaxID=402998 RepID=A0A9Q1L0T8_9SOLA|nr:hypothetical protein K7X08_028762 [Anisodus acutangulus]